MVGHTFCVALYGSDESWRVLLAWECAEESASLGTHLYGITTVCVVRDVYRPSSPLSCVLLLLCSQTVIAERSAYSEIQGDVFADDVGRMVGGQGSGWAADHRRHRPSTW